MFVNWFQEEEQHARGIGDGYQDFSYLIEKVTSIDPPDDGCAEVCSRYFEVSLKGEKCGVVG